jgi:hypothetical protein
VLPANQADQGAEDHLLVFLDDLLEGKLAGQVTGLDQRVRSKFQAGN